jgi:hypothetical protein
MHTTESLFIPDQATDKMPGVVLKVVAEFAFHITEPPNSNK